LKYSASVAQLVEQLICNQQVESSILSISSNFFNLNNMDLYEESMKFVIGDLNETRAHLDVIRQENKALHISNVEMKQYAEEIMHLANEKLSMETFRERVINLTTKIINI
jgi:hypothetical protein